MYTDILEENAEEASFLWQLRTLNASAPHYTLGDLADFDERVMAHLHALYLSGDRWRKVCKDTLGLTEAGDVFTVSFLALGTRNEDGIDEILEAAKASQQAAQGLASALGWLPYAHARDYIDDLLSQKNPDLRYIGITASAIHRQDPGLRLNEALKADNPRLKARALRTAGELGRLDLLLLLQKEIMAEDEDLRFSACWSAALLGEMPAVAILKSFMDSHAYAEKALDLALRRMSVPVARAWLEELAQNEEHTRLVIKGAGIIGDPGFIPGLMEAMNVPKLARIAGEAFGMITSVDIVDAHLDVEASLQRSTESVKDSEADATEDSLDDEAMDLDPDEDLPWPNQELVTAWWDENNNNFCAGERYLLGKPITPEHLQYILRHGYQHQRAAAALELAIMHPGQPLFETRAPGFLQKRLLGL